MRPNLRLRLGHELTALDRREAARERNVNIHRLALYLQAADRVEEDIQAGATPERAFADNFCPTRGMHRVARNLGLALDVQRGQWMQA